MNLIVFPCRWLLKRNDPASGTSWYVISFPPEHDKSMLPLGDAGHWNIPDQRKDRKWLLKPARNKQRERN